MISREEHPRTALAPYVRGEIGADERAAVEAHIVDCASCRSEAESFRRLLGELRAALPSPPPLDARRFGAELRERLEGRRPKTRPVWRWAPLVPLAAAAAALWITLPGHGHRDVSVEEAVGAEFELLHDFPLVENLELLEDFDVVQNLDGLLQTSG